jgi:hypothetical protein
MATTTARHRQLHSSRARGLPYKDDQDREAVKPKAHEYTVSGTDDQTAAHEEAAFNPDETRPEQEKKTAGKGGGGGGGGNNPLEGSPANKDMAEGGQGKEGDKEENKLTKGSQKPSGGGSPEKGGRSS